MNLKIFKNINVNKFKIRKNELKNFYFFLFFFLYKAK
jgi:hypothetical protein